MWRPTALNWQEPTAYLVAIASVALGTYYGTMCDADWLGRAGSVVVVCGVLLAFSRKIDLLHKKTLAFFKAYRQNNPSFVRDELSQILGRVPSANEVEEIESAIYAAADAETALLIDGRRRVLSSMKWFS
jgi:hypothetical protein